MKRIQISALLLIMTLIGIYGCKKDELTSQEFVQNFIIGKWPLKYNIRTISNANFGDKLDTLIKYNPIDTLVFTKEGTVNRVNKILISSMSYTIDEAGENITFKGTTTTTLKLISVRNNSILIGTQTISNSSGKEVTTTIADYLIK